MFSASSRVTLVARVKCCGAVAHTWMVLELGLGVGVWVLGIGLRLGFGVGLGVGLRCRRADHVAGGEGRGDGHLRAVPPTARRGGRSAPAGEGGEAGAMHGHRAPPRGGAGADRSEVGERGGLRIVGELEVVEGVVLVRDSAGVRVRVRAGLRPHRAQP